MQEIKTEFDKLLIEGRKKLSMTGVSSVDGFTDKTLNLTVNGSKMKITGESIKITSFSKTSGNFTADGLFSSIEYNHKKQSFLKRLFR